MKKNVLAVSIAAMIGGLSLAGVASAGSIHDVGATADELKVTDTGVGHILLVPYFSTQNGNVSLLNITNTDTKNGKAVKLRYRGAANSDDIYDITIFLSPGDMWSANVSQENGRSTLVTKDNSCTLPANVNAPFSTARLASGDQGEGTLEGYIEILNMADVPATLANADDGTLGTTPNPLFTATKHVNGVAPCGTIPSQLKDLETFGTADNGWDVRGYNYPTGGLMANWMIMNLGKAGSFTGEATAVVAVDNTGASAKANIVFSPQEEEGVVSNAADLTADPLLVGANPIVKPKNYDFPDLSTPYVSASTDPIDQAHALSYALATASVTNEYMTSPDVGFATDWTFSMPSRRYNVAVDYAANARVVASGAQYFTNANTSYNSTTKQICVNSSFDDLAYFNTEEGVKTTTPGGYVISPQVPGQTPTLAFCGETSVLAFNKTLGATDPTGVLGALIARQSLQTLSKANSTDVYTDGWMSLKTPGNSGLGLPVIGHAFAKALSNSAVSLGGIWKHRTDKNVAVPSIP
ncbi:MAG TPA: cell surface protein [Alicycliphilus sp.]|nr:cell surface protein [Alicycliphilus sp.]